MLRFHNSRQQQEPIRPEDAEYFIQAALDALSAHIAILNERGEIIAVNQAWKEFARRNGYQGDDYGTGTNYLAICDRTFSMDSANEERIMSDGIRKVMSGEQQNFSMEYPCHSPAEKRWFVARVSRFEWYGDIRFIVAHHNVTDLKQAQIELSESKQRIQAILDNVSNGIISFTPEGIIETANRAAGGIFGYSNDELINMSILSLIDEANHRDDIVELLRRNRDQEIIGKRKDGSSFPAQFELDRFKLNGEDRYTVIIRDITLRKQIETELIEKERIALALEHERQLRELRNRFVSMMSHELRTPLTSIQLSADMIRQYDSLMPPEERNQAIENIQHQVRHLSEMITDVITLSQTDTESIHFEPEEADLMTYCRDILEEFQFTYHRTHQIAFESKETALKAFIDRKLLRRALTNLLSNAVKYSPEGGEVALSLSHEDGQAVIKVRDSGIGIPEQDQEDLFKPFHRAKNVETFPGTGLGLAITRHAVEVHSGRIFADSKVGGGTTFTILIPLQRDA